MKKWKIFSSTGSRSHPGKLSLQPPNSLQQKNSERCAAKESECTRCTKGTGCTQSTGYTQGTGLGIHTVLGIHKVLGAHKVRSEHKGSINLYSHRGYKRVGAGFFIAHTKTYPLMLQNHFFASNLGFVISSEKFNTNSCFRSAGLNKLYKCQTNYKEIVKLLSKKMKGGVVR